MDPFDNRYFAGWFGAVVVAYWLCYKSPLFARRKFGVFTKLGIRSFPWALLFAPTIGFGYIPLPMPAGLMITGWIGWALSGGSPNARDHHANGVIACFMILFTWFSIWAFSYFTKTKTK